MALSQNTVTEVFVTSAGLAGDADLATFISSGSDGEIYIGPADGHTAASGAEGVPFIIALKIGTEVITSDIYVSSEVKRAISYAYSAPVLRQINVTPTNLTAGKEYVLNLKIDNYGSLSVEDYYLKLGQYVVVSGDTASDIVDGLIASLNKNFSKEPGATASTNPYFSFTNNAGVLEIAEKDQALDLGRDEGRPLSFDVTVDYIDNAAAATVAIGAGGSPGKGTGKEVALMEYFYRGNRGDGFRQQHFPYNWNLNTKSLADPTAQYGIVTFDAIKTQDEEFNAVTARKSVVIAVPTPTLPANNSLVNAIANQLDSFLSQDIPDLAVV